MDRIVFEHFHLNIILLHQTIKLPLFQFVNILEFIVAVGFFFFRYTQNLSTKLKLIHDKDICRHRKHQRLCMQQCVEFQNVGARFFFQSQRLKNLNKLVRHFHNANETTFFFFLITVLKNSRACHKDNVNVLVKCWSLVLAIGTNVSRAPIYHEEVNGCLVKRTNPLILFFKSQPMDM